MSTGKVTARHVARATALHCLASMYPEMHRMHINDEDLDELFMRAADELARRREAMENIERVERNDVACSDCGSTNVYVEVTLPKNTPRMSTSGCVLVSCRECSGVQTYPFYSEPSSDSGLTSGQARAK